MIVIGWWGINAKNREELKSEVLKDYNPEVKILSTCDKGDHFWVLYNRDDFTSIDCIFIDKDGSGYMYKPISCESGPKYHDIPKNWLSKITSLENRKKMFPNWDQTYLKEWIEEVKGKEGCTEIDFN